MPKLLIELTGVEYDRLCAMARRERRTPNAQAAVVIGTTMEALSRRGDLTDPVAEALEDLDELTEAQRPAGAPLAPEERLGPVQAGRDGP